MRLIITASFLLLSAAPLLAETYSWVDDSGTYNFTEDYSSIPKKYRQKAGKRGDMSAPAASETKPAAPAAAKDQAQKKATTESGGFGGKSYDQWKAEFQTLESGMDSLKKRADAIDADISRSKADNNRTQELLVERKKLAEQFKVIRQEYDQLTESARKAGIKVDVK